MDDQLMITMQYLGHDGTMVSYLNEYGAPNDTRYYVHDYANEAWVEVDSASFVVSPELRGPMVWECNPTEADGSAAKHDKPLLGFGVVALATNEAADALASGLDGALRYNWPGLVENLEPRT